MRTRPRVAFHQHPKQLPDLVHVVARLPLRDCPREDIAGGVQRVQGAGAGPAPVALLPDEPEIPELQAPAVAHEDVQRREVAVEELAAVQLAEHFEDARDLAPRGGFRPPLAVAVKERPEVSLTGVLEREAVQRVAVRARQRERVVDADRPWMSVEHLPEVRLA